MNYYESHYKCSYECRRCHFIVDEWIGYDVKNSFVCKRCRKGDND